MKMELLQVIDQIGREKNIDKHIIIEAVKSAILSAYRKRLHHFSDNLEIVFSEETGALEFCIVKKVVEEFKNEREEITIAEAKKINADAELSSIVKVPHIPRDFGRVAAQIAKQVIIQRVREAEKNSIFQEFKNKEGKLVTGVIIREEAGGDLIIDLGRTEAILPRREQAFRETFNKGEKVELYVVEVKKWGKEPQIIVSRTHPGLLINLFEQEVPEILDRIIEIKGAVREPSGRSKIAVHSNNKDIDPVGSCVGIRGTRVQAVVAELRGEKIDIIRWSEDPVVYVTNALGPAKISKINCHADKKYMEIIVPDDQLSLAIGKKGQNVRLAAKLTRWQLDIKGETVYKDKDIARAEFDKIALTSEG